MSIKVHRHACIMCLTGMGIGMLAAQCAMTGPAEHARTHTPGIGMAYVPPSHVLYKCEGGCSFTRHRGHQQKCEKVCLRVTSSCLNQSHLSVGYCNMAITIAHPMAENQIAFRIRLNCLGHKAYVSELSAMHQASTRSIEQM